VSLPLVSIITPSYNQAAYIEATLRSVLDQDYPRIEYRVIDGASTDGSVEWLQALDDPLAEITIEKDKGIYDAMNKGRLRAIETPGYTLFLNSGDSLADASTLARISAAVESAHIAPTFIYGDFYQKNAQGHLTRRNARPISRARLGLPASHQTMYFENERLRQFEFRLEYRLSADYCMLLEFLKGLDTDTAVLQMPLPLCIFDTTGVSNKRRFEAIREDMQIRMRFLNYSSLNAFGLYLLHYLHTHSKQLRSAMGR
jgi:putative colanic acid biosynthesis glycosyltransferase